MAPPQTTLNQTSTLVKQLDGGQRFEVLSSLSFVKFGDLPHGDIFVHQILITNNPKTDKFLRIAQLGDITSLVRGRDKALAAGASQYLSATCLTTYDSVLVAVQAKSIIQARIDDLIEQWIAYTTKFTTPSEFELPLIDPSIVAAAENAYAAAKAANAAKATALSDAEDALDDASDAATRAAAALNAAVIRQVRCTQIQSLLTSAMSAASTFRGAASSFSSAVNNFISDARVFEDANDAGAVTAFEGQIDAFDTGAYSTFKSAISAEVVNGSATLTALNQAIVDECTLEGQAVTDATTAKIEADAAQAAATTALTVAQAEKTKAQADEESAWVALTSVCPDATP